MLAKLPDLQGSDVLCIGCGSGDECSELADRGARVVGIDRSPELIRIARQTFPGLAFQVMDMEHLILEDNSFDFVYASLTLHYSKSWAAVLQSIGRVMRPRARLLFSVIHPVAWSAETVSEMDRKARLLGYREDGGQARFYGDYFSTNLIQDTWFDFFDVSLYVRPVSEAMRELRDAGFLVTDFLEPQATPAGMDADPRMYARYRRIPLFMIFEAVRPGN